VIEVMRIIKVIEMMKVVKRMNCDIQKDFFQGIRIVKKDFPYERGLLLLSFVFLFLVNSGCAAFDKLGFSKKRSEELLEETSSTENLDPSFTRYSSQGYLPQVQQRDYIRMTKERLEKENDVGSQAGSMWVMDGQGSYLFVQNKQRKQGDVFRIKLEGSALKQAKMKVSVIKKLLAQIEQENKKIKEVQRLSNKDSLNSSSSSVASPKEETSRQVASHQEQDKEGSEFLDTELVPARIIENSKDGYYRVTGQQTFVLGQKDFKVLITGLMKVEDLSEEGTSSEKLLDSEVDVLSVRSKRNEKF
jgi:flagellar L-ring protein FlgH